MYNNVNLFFDNNQLIYCNSMVDNDINEILGDNNSMNTATIFSTIDLNTYELTNHYTYYTQNENLPIFNKVIYYNNEISYVLNMDGHNNIYTITKISGIMSFPLIRQVLNISLPFNCDNITAEYDKSNDIIIVLAFSSENRNFIVSLIKASHNEDNPTMVLGTIDTTISTNIILENNKQLGLILLPCSALITYGCSKTVILYTSYDGPITSGETILDYQTIECIDYLYDDYNSKIITIEKSIANSSYIQIYEILGSHIQKLSSHLLNNIIYPIGISKSADKSKNKYLFMFSETLRETNTNFINLEINDCNIELKLVTSLQENVPYNLLDGIKQGKNIFYIGNSVDSYLCSYQSGLKTIINIIKIDNSELIGYVKKVKKTEDKYLLNLVLKTSPTIELNFPDNFVGKKIYLSNPKNIFPQNFSTDKNFGIYIGLCVENNKRLIITNI